jgi:hypothetical protein
LCGFLLLRCQLSGGQLLHALRSLAREEIDSETAMKGAIEFLNDTNILRSLGKVKK